MTALRLRADAGGTTAGDLYDVLMLAKGSREAVAKWDARRFGLILGPLSVAFTGAMVLGGGDAVLYCCFLLAILVGPAMLAMPLLRRIYMRRYLGSRDVVIVDTARQFSHRR